ncbi:MAG: shikimate kinase, partial [Clostridium sp.]|nr:shikimate kinase [Clostridium sp.]
GKTTLGRALAEALGRPFFDADEEIVKVIGCDIPTYFAREGEAAFRRAETAVLAELGKLSGAVIATGGGCVTRPENYPLLHQNGRIVWLQRVLSALPRAGRPISEATDLQELYAQRRDSYEAFADLAVGNNGEIDIVLAAIISALHLKKGELP